MNSNLARPQQRTIPPGDSIRLILREPLLHFLILGLALYWLVAMVEGPPQQQQIVIGATEISRIKLAYQQQYGVEPAPQQLQKLIDHYIREEIYWREGVALGLDRGDEIVRRRVAQKYAFLQQDLAIPAPPGEGELRRYYQQHGARYAEPARVSFEHIFIAYGKDTDSRVENLAAQLPSISLADSQALGDSFPGQTAVVALSGKELTRLFGDSDIVRAAFSAPPGQWHGPVSSGYGRHFIRVTDKLEPRLPTLAAVADQVRANYLAERTQAQNNAAYRELRAKYQVSVAVDR